jgi:hypothetical protein
MTVMDLSNLPPDAYVSIAMEGDCRLCGVRKDLRCGVCFSCCDRVSGRPIPGGHELWDIDNPRNRWKVLAQ